MQFVRRGWPGQARHDDDERRNVELRFSGRGARDHPAVSPAHRPHDAAAGGGLSRTHPRKAPAWTRCPGRALLRSAIPNGAFMTLSVDLFFSFRSPYSYLALPKTLKLVADYDATVNLRPVYPLAVRVPG